MILKKKVGSRIEGIGLILILISFFAQLTQNDLENSLNESKYYYLHNKLDTIWRVIENDYANTHPESGVHGAINFKFYSDGWKIYSEQLEELKPWDECIDAFTKLNLGLFIIGSILLIIPKFVEDK